MFQPQINTLDNNLIISPEHPQHLTNLTPIIARTHLHNISPHNLPSLESNRVFLIDFDLEKEITKLIGDEHPITIICYY